LKCSTDLVGYARNGVTPGREVSVIRLIAIRFMVTDLAKLAWVIDIASCPLTFEVEYEFTNFVCPLLSDEA